MFAHAFRFDPFKRSPFRSDAFQARMRSTFAPRKPRHRVLRVIFGLIGVALLAVLVMLGLFIGAAMIATGIGYKLWKQRGKSAIRVDARRGAFDAEYRVVAPLSLPR
jgi:NAD/NADP transhydrogenase alpha subunit